MNVFEFAIARCYSQLLATSELRPLMPKETLLLTQLIPCIDEYEEREMEQERYQPLRPPLAMGGGE